MFSGLTAAVISFAVTVVLTIACLPPIYRYCFGQGAEKKIYSRKNKPDYPPAFGGILYAPAIAAGLIGAVLTAKLTGGSLIDGGSFLPANARIRWWACVLFALGAALVGFACDRVNMRMGRGFELDLGYRIAFEGILLAGLVITLSRAEATFVSIPFLGNRDLGFLYYLLFIPIAWLTLNASRLTDGIPGLHTAAAAVNAAGLGVCALLRGQDTALAVALAALGAALAFLPFHAGRTMAPGKTGTYALGALSVACGVMTDMIWLPLLTGLGFVAEWFSAVLPVAVFRLSRGKRSVKAHPLHNFLKERGASDRAVTAWIAGANLAGSALAVGLVLLGFER